MPLILKITGDGLPKLNRALDELGKETKAHRAYRVGINRVGGKAFTRVKRALSKQTGLTQKALKAKGNLRATRANFTNLEYTISASGRPISLKEFKARQFSWGVRASPWGNTQRFESAFIFAGSFRSGNTVANGHVFIRVSGNSTPIRKLWGPSIPVELVKDESAKAFHVAARRLKPEVNRLIVKITGGVIS